MDIITERDKLIEVFEKASETIGTKVAIMELLKGMPIDDLRFQMERMVNDYDLEDYVQ